MGYIKAERNGDAQVVLKMPAFADYEYTGECRQPVKGEFFLDDTFVYKAEDCTYTRHYLILRKKPSLFPNFRELGPDEVIEFGDIFVDGPGRHAPFLVGDSIGKTVKQQRDDFDNQWWKAYRRVTG